MKPLKRALALNPDVLPEETRPDFTFRYVDISNVDSKGRIGQGEILSFARAPSRARRLVIAGDCVVSTVRTYLKAIGRVGRDAPEIVFSTGFAVLRPDEDLSSDFLFYALQAEPFIQRVVSHSEGIGYPAIAPIELGCLPIVLPDLPEQRSIAAFLDRETAKIDALIAKKERLIELLEEKRAALITQAVTRGLDPSVPMKESGVEWIGEIPAHWSVAPVYSRFVVQLGKMLDASRISGQHLGPYIRNVDVQWDRVNVEDLPEMDFSPADRERFSLRTNDLLVCEGGEVGRAAIWRGELQECFYQKAIHRLRSRSTDDHPRFLFYILRAAATLGVFVAAGNPNTIDHLTADKLRKHRFAFPSKDEQQAISAFLDRETAKLDALIAKIREAIDKLREYRTALISAAVTGKIDVRTQPDADGSAFQSGVQD